MRFIVIILILLASCTADKKLAGKTLVLQHRASTNQHGYIEFTNTWRNVKDGTCVTITTFFEPDYNLGDTLGKNKVRFTQVHAIDCDETPLTQELNELFLQGK
jgi:hypothetical protein